MNVFDRIKGAKQGKPLTAIQVKHTVMQCYGWIPTEEYKKITIKEILELYQKAVEEYSKQENLRLASLQYYGVKNPK